MNQPRTFSTSKAILIIILVFGIALIFVNREVGYDEAMREVRALELKVIESQMDLAEARIELEKLATFPNISQVAQAQGFATLTTTPKIISVHLNDLPPEFRREVKSIKSKTRPIDD
jgi:cell division protein FtsL